VTVTTCTHFAALSKASAGVMWSHGGNKNLTFSAVWSLMLPCVQWFCWLLFCWSELYYVGNCADLSSGVERKSRGYRKSQDVLWCSQSEWRTGL